MRNESSIIVVGVSGVRIRRQRDIDQQTAITTTINNTNHTKNDDDGQQHEQVVQRLIPQLPTLENLLNYLISACKMEVRV